VRGNESAASPGLPRAEKPKAKRATTAGTDTIKYYLQAAGAEPLLTHDEEIALALHLREQLVRPLRLTGGLSARLSFSPQGRWMSSSSLLRREPDLLQSTGRWTPHHLVMSRSLAQPPL
jgi:hypothetical protein